LGVRLLSRLLIANSRPAHDTFCKECINESGSMKLLPKTYFSSSSTTSPTGEHSNTIIPGKPGARELLEGASGIVKTESETQDPESGISNLRSSQIAVASLSGFRDNQMSHESRNVGEWILCIYFLMTLRKEP
jgi:hypothetical protein